MKVLYIEDNPINRLLLEKSLHTLCTITTEENGFKGLEIAEQNDFDIFILDLNLSDPKIDGFGVLQNLKRNQQYQSALFVALTAYTGDEWETKCKLAGFDLYFSKPVQVKLMWEEITRQFTGKN